MKRTLFASLAFSAIALSTALPTFAQTNLSDITGPAIHPPNLSDITGPGVSNPPNLSDITGPGSNPPNLSDITGNNVSSNTTARTRRALDAGFDENGLNDLANNILEAFTVCNGGGDCSTLVSLLEVSESILGESGTN